MDLFSRVIPSPEKLGIILMEGRHHRFSRFERGFEALCALASGDEATLRVMKASSVGLLNKMNDAVWNLCYQKEGFDELLPPYPFESVRSVRENIMEVCKNLQVATNDTVLNQERNYSLLTQMLCDLLKQHHKLFQTETGTIARLKKCIPIYCSDNLKEFLSLEESPLTLCHEVEHYVRALTESKVSSDLQIPAEIRSLLVWRDGDIRNLKNQRLMTLLSQLSLHEEELLETIKHAHSDFSKVPTQKLDRFHAELMDLVEIYLLRHQQEESKIA